MRHVANKPVADFLCPACASDYELKSKKGKFATKATDGAYATMISRINRQNAPSFFFLGHDGIRVHTFFTVPAHYFTPDIIEKRRPLGPTARRAGWVGCNILLRQIPASGRIYYIRNGEEQSRQQVMDTYAATSFLRNTASSQLRGWLLDVMWCIEKLGEREFALNDVYRFEHHLAVLHPQNHHIRPKIRQQLQYLRDMGYLSFTGRGKYRLTFTYPQ